ncbi:MAG TPA: hypothetical protein VLK37_12300 [Solirubrobacterales bacterium]|nr:hypothetical protein [Solirubrobacterales bacterium]
MNSETRDGIEWVDKGLDRLREEIDGHFARQSKELGKLRREVEHLTRKWPSLFARWGFANLPKAPGRSYSTSTSSRGATPPTGLAWTDGRLADLKSHVRDASTRASDEVAEIEDQIEEFHRETSERGMDRLTWLFYFFLAMMAAVAWIPRIVAAIQS